MLSRLPALHWQIAIALVLAIAAGFLLDDSATFLAVADFLGELFLNALRMLIVPLIVSSMMQAMLNLPAASAVGRLGARLLGWIGLSTLLAVIVGMLMINTFQPGVIDGQPAGETLGLDASTAQVTERVEGAATSDIADIFLRMLPPNIVGAAVETQMLGLIVFSLLFGFFASRLRGELRDQQHRFWQGVYEIMLQITALVMRFAPIGVFALVGATVAKTGWEAFGPLLVFFGCVAGALLLHLLVVLPALVRVLGGVSGFRHLQAMMPALLTAFSTSSSAATLPVSLDCVQRRAGVSPSTSGFVLPLGATVNMNGTALYECAAALFIAQAYGLDLSLASQFLVVMLALLTSVGVAGVPSASLVAIAVILGAIGLPLEGVGLILAVDRILDMMRTAVNVYGDTCGAVIIARGEGESPYAADPDSASADHA
ncbi:dicarboxylate/amino acid:cation symporter [Algiphilus sp.]|uniref:dicarboxylate/amino acid:cation symporter n=1 Tax=Algiphilus sp. TaxID=1872431 RepID=UPI0025B8B33D|nr:dicarboxylate/amino acid:cation symporter [Algiphilus sp.]MCK5771590.1 dicarboxylate/amino acid:cation symporter [Algiphilus sp.]